MVNFPIFFLFISFLTISPVLSHFPLFTTLFSLPLTILLPPSVSDHIFLTFPHFSSNFFPFSLSLTLIIFSRILSPVLLPSAPFSLPPLLVYHYPFKPTTNPSYLLFLYFIIPLSSHYTTIKYPPFQSPNHLFPFPPSLYQYYQINPPPFFSHCSSHYSTNLTPISLSLNLFFVQYNLCAPPKLRNYFTPPLHNSISNPIIWFHLSTSCLVNYINKFYPSNFSLLSEYFCNQFTSLSSYLINLLHTLFPRFIFLFSIFNARINTFCTSINLPIDFIYFYFYFSFFIVSYNFKSLSTSKPIFNPTYHLLICAIIDFGYFVNSGIMFKLYFSDHFLFPFIMNKSWTANYQSSYYKGVFTYGFSTIFFFCPFIIYYTYAFDF